MLSFDLLPSAFGVRVRGFDAKDLSQRAHLTDVIRALYTHQFVVCPGQRLDEDDLEAYAALVGAPDPHFLDHLHMRGRPAIIKLSNVFVDGVRTGIFNGASFWHTDVAYQSPPNAATIIYSVEAPEKPAPVELCDTFAAYDSLPDRLKVEIENLKVVHHYGNRDDLDEASSTSAETLTEAQRAKVKAVLQPLVKRHPFSGRKSLYGVAGSSFGIEGMPDDEAIDLLNTLKRHAIQERFITSHNYSKGDLVMWDNYSTLHRGPVIDAVGPGDVNARVMWRISVHGVSPLLQAEAAEAAFAL